MTRAAKERVAQAWLARYDRCEAEANLRKAGRAQFGPDASSLDIETTFRRHVAAPIEVDGQLYVVRWPLGVASGLPEIYETVDRVIECPDCDGFGYFETDLSTPEACSRCRGTRLVEVYPDEEDFDELVIEAMHLNRTIDRAERPAA